MAAVAYPAGTAVSDGVYARTWADGASATRESLKARGAREDIFLVRGTEAFSRARLEDDPAVWTGELSKLLAERWPGLEGAEATDTFAKRWRYAEPTAGFSLSSANSPVLQRGSIFFAGDALGAQPGRQGIDAAFFSARATAAAVARLLGLGL